MGLVADFLRHLKAVRNCSPATVRAYEGDLAAFAGFAGGEGGMLKADVPLLRRFLLERSTKNYAKSSTARALACLRTFYGWLLRAGRLASNPVKLLRSPKRDRKLPGFMEEEEVARLIGSAENERDAAILEVLYGGGLRVSEAVGLDVDDLSMEEGIAKVRGKGDKERLAPLGSAALRAIDSCLSWRSRRLAEL